MGDPINHWRWTQASIRHRKRNPLCEFCKRAGRVTQATLVDHIIPRAQAPELMWDPDNWQSLCDNCHNVTKQQQEHYGYHNMVDDSGWPVDPQHPANGGAHTSKQAYSIPHWVRPSRIPVHLVCGPPGSGKSTYVQEHRKQGDLVIDFDDIRESICGDRYTDDPVVVEQTFVRRASLIRSLADRRMGVAWLVVVAASTDERAAWVRALGKVQVHVMSTSADLCKQRIMSDPRRKGHEDMFCQRVDAFYRSNPQKGKK
jgi:5-methylcytosine-specific restriction protein A